MLPTFVIGLREGVEAALIVGIIAAFLAKDPRGREAMRWMWIGVAAAVGLCVAAGVALELVNQELPHREQEGLESVIAALAVGAVTFMIVWMRKHARSMSKDLRASAGAALAAGSTGALVAMAFFAVFREGMETSVFLLAAFQSSTDAVSAGFGALLGVLVAVAIGIGIYRGGVKLNLTRFFRMTGVVLVFVAAGLVASALHAAHDAGWLNAGQGHAVDLSWLVVPGTWTAALLTGMLGLRPAPALAEVAGYVIYALPMLTFLLLPDRFRPRPSRRRALRTASTATLLVLVAGILLTACGGSGDDGASKPSRADAAAVATTYADLVLAAYDASIASTEKLSTSVDAFLDTPSSARLAATRKAWLSARDDYIVTEPFRFYGGPIDDPKDGPEGQINAWPMDEAYVDYVEGQPKAGIVNDAKAYPKITADVIVAANEQGGETNISSGWHAIEFLLWGQDRSKTGPGDRPASDYTSAPNAHRRGDYLRLTTKQLLADLESVRDQWSSTGGAFRTAFLADPDRALRRIMRGIGALAVGELAGERMAVAFESGDQEDEHSCFSDNTNADVVNDIKGIRAVYEADLGGVSGPSLQSLLDARDPELAAELRREIEGALAKAQAFPATFETMLAGAEDSPERAAMEDVIDGLEDFGESLGEAAEKLEVKVGFTV
jgi:FTR1 family protein